VPSIFFLEKLFFLKNILNIDILKLLSGY